MGALDTLKSFGNSIIGNTEKACIIMHRKSADQIDTQKVEGSSSLTQAALKGTQALQTGGGGPSVLHVQYNPSSLSIQANAEPIPFTYLQSNIDQGVPNQDMRPPSVVLTVQLYFDAVNKQDSFMFEKADLTVGSIASDIAGALKTYTVQPQTNGLLASQFRPDTRVVTFMWGDMKFTGVIVEAQAMYTMFSVSGRPVRSVVQLKIAHQVESKSDQQYWNEALDGAFQKGKGAGQTLGNLLNLNNF